MRKMVPDTLFLRLFALLFVILSISFITGREVMTMLGWEPISPQPHHFNPFRLDYLVIRLFVATVSAWIAAAWLAKPIRRLAQAAEQLGKNLNSPPIDENSGPAEVKQASRVFNQMQARVQQQLEERGRFLAAVSHDLRTPLTRLKLRAEKIESAELKAAVQGDINEMADIIDTTLEYLRGDQQPEQACLLDIGALVHSLAEDAREYGGTIEVSGNAHPLQLQPLAMRRCLNNLISNALRYGERASITIRETANDVAIAIHDAGPGIPEDKLEAVFAPFFRLETSRSRHTGGVGLGLSIAREMARKHGGDILLKNAPEGGLIATLVLPRVPVKP